MVASENKNCIRSFVNSVAAYPGRKGMDEKMAAWVEWAMKKADWFDPTVARDDDLLGKREYEKNLSEKTLKKNGYYW